MATSILGLLCNAGELFVIVWKDFGAREFSPILPALSYSALGFLKSVVVHSALKNSENEKLLLPAFELNAIDYLLRPIEKSVVN